MKNRVYKLVSEVLGGMNARGQISVLPNIDITVPGPEFGDYTTNIALRLAKPMQQSPSQVAQGIIRELQLLDTTGDFESITEKAGFINFSLSRTALIANLETVLEQGPLYGASISGAGKKVLVEYFQPNMAKPLHLGHLRTAVIGDSIFRILQHQGYRAESDTHLGDWGTQFGLLIHAYKKYGDAEVIAKDPIVELNKLYVRINADAESDPAVRELGKAEFVKLEQRDTENTKLWQQFRDWSWAEYSIVYDVLGIRKSDHDWPESFFADQMPAVVTELKEKGLLKESQGAQIVDLEEHGLGVAVVVKSDEGTTYLLRDLATYIFRKKQGFERQIYVVDVRQSHALAQTKKILELLGYVTESDEFTHVAYGFLSLPEGAMSTRKGTVVGLTDVVEKLVLEAHKTIEEKNADVPNKDEVARAVGTGALKYYDLSRNLRGDIVFRWEDALAFEGSTGPYLQYTNARIHSIIRKAGGVPDQGASSLNSTDFAPAEQAVLRKITQLPEVVRRAAQELMPSVVTQYLFELAQVYNSFYSACPVIAETDPVVKAFRLRLCAATAQVLENGMDLLGMSAPQEM